MSAPVSIWSASVARTGSKRGSQVPCTSAMGTPFSSGWADRGAVGVPAGLGNLLTRRPGRQWEPSTGSGRRSLTSVYAAYGRRRGRLGTERPGRGADTGPGRPRGRGVRGGADHRWRDPHRGPDARGLPPRRVLGGASVAGGVSVLPLARPCRPGRRVAPARGGLRPSSRRRPGRRALPGRRRDGRSTSAATRRPTRTSWARWSSGSTGSCRTCSGRCAASRGTRWPSPGSRWSGRRRSSARRGGSAPTRRGHSSPGAAAHSMEPLTAPLTSAFGLLLTALGHGAGWPVVEGGSAAITHRVWRTSCADWAASSTPTSGSRRWPSSRRHVPCCSTPRRAPSSRWPAAQLLASGRPALGPVPSRLGHLQGRLGPRRPGAVAGRRLPAHGDRPCLRHLRRGGAVGGGGPGRAARRAALRAGGPTRASSTRRGRRRGSTRCGATATCPTAHRST